MKARFRIMVVEDEALIAMELEDRLEGLGYEVCGSFARGENAVAQAPIARPDLILMDVRLAGAVSGIEAALEIERLDAVPVVFLTAYAGTLKDDARVRSYPCVSKPFGPEQLHRVIEDTLEGRRPRA